MPCSKFQFVNSNRYISSRYVRSRRIATGDIENVIASERASYLLQLPTKL